MSYRCQGCGKTSRIAAHEPGCPVDAAWRAQAESGVSGYVINPEAVGDPNQTPRVQLFGYTPTSPETQLITLTKAALDSLLEDARRQERERIAASIDEEAEFETGRMFPSSLAIKALRSAAAIARSHSQEAEEENHDAG